MRTKFQKRSALKFDGRIIPEAKPRGDKFSAVMCVEGTVDDCSLQ